MPGTASGGAWRLSGDTVVVGAPSEASNATGIERQSDGQHRPPGGGRRTCSCAAGRRGASRRISRPRTPSRGRLRLERGISGEHNRGRRRSRPAAPPASTGTRRTTAPRERCGLRVRAQRHRPGPSRRISRPPMRRTGDLFGRSVAVAVTRSSSALWSRRQQRDRSRRRTRSDNGIGPRAAAYVFVRSGTTWSQQAYLGSATRMPDRQVRVQRARRQARRLWSGAISGSQQCHGRERGQGSNQRPPESALRTSSCAAARRGPSRPTSRRETRASATNSDAVSRSRATPWRWPPKVRTATPPA